MFDNGPGSSIQIPTGSPAVRAAMHLKSGNDALARGDYDRAAMEFTQCIQLEPENKEAYARRGDVLKTLGRYDAAVADYSSSLQFDGSDTATRFSRSQLLSYLGRHDEAVSELNILLSDGASDPSWHLCRGQSLLNKGDAAEALRDFDLVLEKMPGNAFAFMERGTAKMKLNRYEEAVLDFNRATQLNPFLTAAVVRRAEANRQLGRHAQAAADLTEAIRLTPQDASLYVARAEAQLVLGSTAPAITDLEEAIRLSPREAALRGRCGEAFRRAGNLLRAEAELTAALEASPGQFEWITSRGQVRLDRGDHDGALADFAEAERRMPGSGSTIGMAKVYVARGDFETAIPHLDRVIEQHPKASDAYTLRAECHARLERLEQATNDVNVALAASPDDSPARRLRAEIAIKAENFDSAYDDLAHLIRLSPQDPFIYLLRGRMEFRRRRLDAAAMDLSLAVKLNPVYAEALAERAAVYRAQKKHYDALFDLVVAVQQDTKFSAEYLVQRGIIHGCQGQYNRAITDFIVALHIDPSNKGALRGKELVTQLRDNQGEAKKAEGSQSDRLAEAEYVMNDDPTAPKRSRAWQAQSQIAGGSRGDAGRGPVKLGRPGPLTAPPVSIPDKTAVGTSGFEDDLSFEVAPEVAAFLAAAERAMPGDAPPRNSNYPDDILGDGNSDPDLNVLGDSTDFSVSGPGSHVLSANPNESTDFEFDDGSDEVEAMPMRSAAQTKQSNQTKPAAPKPPAKGVSRPGTPAAKNASSKSAEMPKPPAKSVEAPKPAPKAPAKSVELKKPAAAPPAKPAAKPAPKAAPAGPKLSLGERLSRLADKMGDEDESKGKKYAKLAMMPVALVTVCYILYTAYDFAFGGSADYAFLRKDADNKGMPQGDSFSAKDLAAKYAKDGKAANSTYNDKPITLSGKVKSVNAEVVELDTAPESISILCEFASKDVAAGLKPGVSVSLQGRMRSRASGTDPIKLGGCLIPQAPPADD